MQEAYLRLNNLFAWMGLPEIVLWAFIGLTAISFLFSLRQFFLWFFGIQELKTRLNRLQADMDQTRLDLNQQKTVEPSGPTQFQVPGTSEQDKDHFIISH